MTLEVTKSLSASGYDVTPISREERDSLAQHLTAEQREILLNQGTEPAFCGNLLDNEKDGTYACALCGLPLFKSSSKFHSGTGWPSFFEPYDDAHIRELHDTKYGMVRVEIRCARCDGHLGHVFPDGPAPTGNRYCLNSASIEFFSQGVKIPQKTQV
jgi:peptide-methionine (R)-S-oxide reductase